MADDMTNQRGFSRPQKSSDNSCRNTGIHLDKLRLINNGKPPALSKSGGKKGRADYADPALFKNRLKL
jgi:hypothetical protein